MWTARAFSDPGREALVELTGSECGGWLNLHTIGEPLTHEGILAEDPPPALDEVQLIFASRKELLMDARMLGQPLSDPDTGVAGDMVVDQEELSSGIRPLPA
jgi:hypothetical protein